MLTLALDTSTPVGSVALGTAAGEVLAASSLPVHMVHSETVLPEIDRLVASIRRTPADLERIVVGSGPGSFTGVRIAAALAKGIRAALDAELFAYSSLAAIAAGTDVAGPVCAAIDARRGQVYAAGYEIGPDGVSERFAPVAAPFDAVLDRLPSPDRWTLAAAIPDRLRYRAEAHGLRVLPEAAGVPCASSLLRLVTLTPAAGRVACPDTWEPEYVRASSAEREAAG